MKTTTFISICLFLFVFSISTQAQVSLKANQPSLELVKEEGEQVLKWSLTKEVNSSYFIVEQSQNGEDFQPLATIKAKGHSTLATHYSLDLEDWDTLTKKVYRVTLVTMDGLRAVATARSVDMPETQFIAAEAHR